MKNSEQIDALISALAKAKSEMAVVPMSGRNPFFKTSKNPEGSPYSTLTDLFSVANPALSKNALVLIQCPYTNEGRISVTTTLFHSSGQWIQNEGIPLRAEKDTAQGVATVITYSKRQEAFAILGLSGDVDDDGNEAETSLKKSNERPQSSPKEEQQQKQPQQQKQTPNIIFESRDAKHAEWLEKALNKRNLYMSPDGDDIRKEILEAMNGRTLVVDDLENLLKEIEAKNNG